MDIRASILFLLVLPGLFGSIETNRAQFELVNKLLTNYSTDVRPIEYNNETVTVLVGIAVNQLIDMDERNQVLTLNLWMRMKWQDFYMTWDPAEWEGITELYLHIDRLWKPDITLFNDVRESKRDVTLYPLIVNHKGTVQWIYPTIMKSSCLLDVTYFPWDQQACPLKFASWSFDGGSLDIWNRSEEGDLSFYIENGEWNMKGIPFKRNEKLYKCCVHPFPDITFWMILERKPMYYLFNLIMPCCFITATTILVFYLPVESGEKVSLGVTVLLALTVFLLLVAETMPPQSIVIPLIAQYFGATIMMLATSTAVTVVIINVHYRGVFGNDVPIIVRKIVLEWLSRPMCLKGLVDENVSIRKQKQKKSQDSQSSLNGYSNGGIDMGGELGDKNHVTQQADHQFDEGRKEEDKKERQLTRLLEIAEHFYSNMTKSKEQDHSIDDWRLVAMVLDRLFLWVFTIMGVSMTCIILTQRGNEDDYLKTIEKNIV